MSAQNVIVKYQEIHDTIVSLRTDTIWVLQNQPVEESSLFKFEISVGDILTIIGFIITIVLFICQVRNARSDYKTNQRDSWMLNVVIQPYIEHLNNMYLELTKMLNKEISDLNNKSDKGNKNKRINEIAKLKRKTKNHINDFFVHFTTLLMATDKATAIKITNLASALEDTCTDLIDKYEEYKDILTVRKPILDNKQKVIASLYASMKSDNKEKD